jgi:hypothetical protein
VFRSSLLVLAVLPLLSGCAFFGIERRAAPPLDPSEATYRAAMADFSACATAPDAATAARLSQAAATMQADARPTNPDHFFMTDRVTAAATYCAEAVAR